VGDGTQIDVAGDIRVNDRRVSLRALGDANLSLLQAVLPDVSTAGQAEVQADIRGTLDRPVIRGAATITNGRLRQFALPHAIDAINGRLEFDAGGLRFDGVTGTFGGGPVRFGGRVAFDGFWPAEYGITIAGTGMRIRYPEGFRSEIDADIALRGKINAPLLSGVVNVRDSVYEATIDTGGTGIFGVAAAGTLVPVQAASGAPESLFSNLRYDVRITAPGTLRIENRTSRVVTTADLALRGTYWTPLLFGRVDINRGEVFFEGNRYSVARGTIDFSNAERIEPFFDIEAETRARVPGQIYRVVFHVSGTPDRFSFDLTSDPPLNQIDILSLLFGDVQDPLNAEVDAIRRPDRAEQDLIAARAARMLASPLSSEVGRVVEQTLNVDTVQITPSLGDVSTQQFARLNPSARLTLGKRVSDKLFLTYSRALSVSTRDQIILLEYIQSDRFTWIISQNEDRTYAVDVRMRHAF
jgi:autotransporter translocation and assembly factor TamB